MKHCEEVQELLRNHCSLSASAHMFLFFLKGHLPREAFSDSPKALLQLCHHPVV